MRQNGGIALGKAVLSCARILMILMTAMVNAGKGMLNTQNGFLNLHGVSPGSKGNVREIERSQMPKPESRHN